MSRSLVQLLIDAHRDEARDHAVPWLVRPEHVVLDQQEGGFALGALEATGMRAAAGVALLVLDARGTHAGEFPSDDVETLKLAALRCGVHVALPGLGCGGHVYAERFAAPLRLALGCAPDLALTGALGMLAWPASRLEAAAALAGARHALAPPELHSVRLVGGPGIGISGHDIAIELGRRLPPPRGERVIEMRGPGIERLAMRDRFAIASDAGALGSRAVVFPSDETTHAWLRAHGRDADWKRSPPDVEEAGALELELEVVEPLLQRPEQPETVRAVRHAAGTRVSGVIVGPRATYGDWVALAARLRGFKVDGQVTCLVVPGSRRLLETARARGVLQDLAEAGVDVITAGGTTAAAWRHEGTVLHYAVEDAGAEGAHRDAWRASLESCAAAALTGAITDPRELAAVGPQELEPAEYVIGRDRVVAPALEPAAPVPRSRAPAPRRGVVVLRAGDDVTTTRVLPLGPRLARLEPDRLADLAFAAADGQFAARARQAGAGWLLAGRGFLCGPRRDLVAWMLARLGIRAVIARGYADGAATALVHAGILPLLAREREDRSLAPGDELEMPGGLEAVEPGVPVTVRDLTRGMQFLLNHPLGEHEVTLLRSGGILGQAAPEREA